MLFQGFPDKSYKKNSVLTIMVRAEFVNSNISDSVNISPDNFYCLVDPDLAGIHAK